MTIGTDQLDQWTKTLAEADMLYREVQLLVRINPEAYRVDDDTIAAIGAANADAWDDGGMIHPLVFAKTWAWHLAGEARSIPPVTSNWVTLIRYISANLQYLDGEDRDFFSADLRWLRGSLGAWVNENGLSQGEAVILSALRGREARDRLRAWARDSDEPLTRKELATIYPELDKQDWIALRVRKTRTDEDIPARMYPASWVAGRGSDFDTTPVNGYGKDGEDVYDDWDRYVSLDQMVEAGQM